LLQAVICEELSGQAQVLRETVNKFEFGERGAYIFAN